MCVCVCVSRRIQLFEIDCSAVLSVSGNAAATLLNSCVTKVDIMLPLEPWNSIPTHLLDVVASLGTGLNKHDIQSLCLLLSFLHGDLTLVLKIGLVSH